MKIAIISAGVLRKKSFERNLSLARGLVRCGCEVTLLTCSDDFRYKEECLFGVRVVAFPEILSYRLRKGGLGLIDAFSRVVFMTSKNYDIVHADVGFRPAAGLPGHLYTKIKRVPYVCDWWDWIGNGGALDNRSRIYRSTLGASDNFFEVWDKKHADGIITISQCLYDRARSLGIEEEKLVIIHGGADVEGIDYVPKSIAREQLGLDKKSLIIGFSGMGPFEYADLLPFFKALPAIRAEFRNFSWFSTGDALPMTVRQEFNIGNEYRDLGWIGIDDYKKYLRAADILLLPLRDDLGNRARWPNKLGDYLAAGRPIISTPVGEVAAFAKRFPDSLAAVQWNSETIAKRIIELGHDQERMENIGRLNFKIASQHYSWDEKAKEFYNFYRRIVRRHRHECNH